MTLRPTLRLEHVEIVDVAGDGFDHVTDSWPCPACADHRPAASARHVLVRRRHAPSRERFFVTICAACLRTKLAHALGR